MSAGSDLRKRCARWALPLYLAALTVATHWPKLEINAGPPSTDKFLHCLAFGLIPILLWLTGWFRSLWVVLAAALAWAGLDELSQAVPGVERSVTWNDFFASAMGVVAATIAIALARRARPRQSGESAEPRR
jgi:hypothetical protein